MMTMGTMNDIWAQQYASKITTQAGDRIDRPVYFEMYKTESVHDNNSNCINRMPDIDRVIFNGPATIVLWGDGTKTVVKCDEWDVFDKEKGLAMAIAKRAFGNKGSYNNVFKKWIDESEYDPYIQQCYDQGEQLSFTEVFPDISKALDMVGSRLSSIVRPDGAEDGDI